MTTQRRIQGRAPPQGNCLADDSPLIFSSFLSQLRLYRNSQRSHRLRNGGDKRELLLKRWCFSRRGSLNFLNDSLAQVHWFDNGLRSTIVSLLFSAHYTLSPSLVATPLPQRSAGASARSALVA